VLRPSLVQSVKDTMHVIWEMHEAKAVRRSRGADVLDRACIVRHTYTHVQSHPLPLRRAYLQYFRIPLLPDRNIQIGTFIVVATQRFAIQTMTTTNKKNVKEKALDLLCGDDDLWTWGGTDAGCYFAFDRDGTGTVSPPKPTPTTPTPHSPPSSNAKHPRSAAAKTNTTTSHSNSHGSSQPNLCSWTKTRGNALCK
jgi:hypothetical protein